LRVVSYAKIFNTFGLSYKPTEKAGYPFHRVGFARRKYIMHDLAKRNFASEGIMKRRPLGERMKHGNQFDDSQMSQVSARHWKI
jgi:hypothetical protein